MYTQTLKNGKTRFFESYLDPMTMERKTVSVTLDKNTTQSRKTAQEALSARIKRLQNASYDQTHITLQELSDAYKEGRAPYLREQTLDAHMYTIKGAVKILGPKTVVNHLTAGYVLRKFDADPHSVTWKNEKLKRLRTMLRWGKKRGLVKDISWLEEVERYEDHSKERRENKYLEKEELERLVKAMEIYHHKMLTIFLVLTGLRIGEALALTPEDIDIQERVIHVTKTYIPSKKRVGPTKTDGSTRDVFIQNEMLPVLAVIKAGKHVFEHNGQPVAYDAYRKYLGEISEKAIGRKIVPHTLRHTHTSLMAAAGVPLETIARRLGHADSKITREIYFHVTKQLRDRDRNLLNAAKLMQKPTRDLRGGGKTKKAARIYGQN